MRFFPCWHSPKSVAKQLIEGLESGALTLAPPTPDLSEVIAEIIRISTEINAAFARDDPDYIPPETPTAEMLSEYEKRRPGGAQGILDSFREIHSSLTMLDATRRRYARYSTWLRWSACLQLIASACLCVYAMASDSAPPRFALGFLLGSALGACAALFLPWRILSSPGMQPVAVLRRAAAELIPKVWVTADGRVG